jgi:hypothetical protein
VDAYLVGEMGKLTHLYADQSRGTPTGVAISALQSHLRNYLDLATADYPTQNVDTNVLVHAHDITAGR